MQATDAPELVKVTTLHGSCSITLDDMANETAGINHYINSISDLLIDLNAVEKRFEQLRLVSLIASESRRYYKQLSAMQ